MPYEFFTGFSEQILQVLTTPPLTFMSLEDRSSGNLKKPVLFFFPRRRHKFLFLLPRVLVWRGDSKGHTEKGGKGGGGGKGKSFWK